MKIRHSTSHKDSDVISRSAATHICPDCDGVGVVYWDKMVDYHKRDHITLSRDCKRCKCRGVVVRITRVNERPLKPSEFALCRNHNG